VKLEKKSLTAWNDNDITKSNQIKSKSYITQSLAVIHMHDRIGLPEKRLLRYPIALLKMVFSFFLSFFFICEKRAKDQKLNFVKKTKNDFDRMNFDRINLIELILKELILTELIYVWM
jgi:hypothetical protein